MSFLNAGLILEITPFLAIIIVETATAGGQNKFAGEFRKQPEYKEINNQASASSKNINYTALLSYDFEQSMRYLDIAIVSTFVIYMTKLFNTNNGDGLIVVSGVANICFIVGLRVMIQRYFESKTPTEYARKDLLKKWKGFEIRWGDLSVFIANLIPILSLIFLTLQ